MKLLRYIELKSDHAGNGPAWIGYVTPSKTGRTLYFNGRALMKLKGQRRLADGGNYMDIETHESFWVSGVKKNGEDRHWAGSGRILVEADAVAEYLNTTGAKTLDRKRHDLCNSLVQTDISRFEVLSNARMDDGDAARHEMREDGSTVVHFYGRTRRGWTTIEPPDASDGSESSS